jgi:hypothetical protein
MADQRTAEEVGRLYYEADRAATGEPRDELYAAVRRDETRVVRMYADRLPDGDWTLDELVDEIRSEVRGER